MLLHHLKYNGVLSERVILLTVLTEQVPHVPLSRRLEIEKLDAGFSRVVIRYGFMDSPDVPVALRLATRVGLDIEPDTATYDVGHQTLVPTKEVEAMALWRENMFAFANRNAQQPIFHFGVPPERVVKLGVQVRM